MPSRTLAALFYHPLRTSRRNLQLAKVAANIALVDALTKYSEEEFGVANLAIFLPIPRDWNCDADDEVEPEAGVMTSPARKPPSDVTQRA